jgi:2-polyprenyl-6-methoxyphenol hydroxylase-like FAD-dependent oxidoreductase
MTDQPFKVLIAGGGIAGPAVAYWLSRIPSVRPLAITVLERSTTPRQTGQAIDLRGPGVEVARRMGLEAAIRACHTNERGITRTTAAGRTIATFDASGDTRKQAMTSELEILRADLARILCDTAGARPGVEFVFGDYPSALAQAGADGKVHVEFTNGKLPTGEYDLVVGADGTLSRTRPHVTGRPAQEDVYDLGTYVAYYTIPRAEHDSPTHGRWWSVTEGRSVLLRPSRAGTAVFLLVRRQDPALLAAITQGAAAQKAAVAEAFADVGPESARLLAGLHASDDFYFQQVAQVRAGRWSAGRVVLVGDAGYGPSPFTGMGTSLAAYGAYVLAGELGQALRAGGDGDVPAALARYERLLRPYVTKIQKIPRGLLWVLYPMTGLGVWMLDWVVWLVNVSRIYKLAGTTRGEDHSVPEYTWMD